MHYELIRQFMYLASRLLKILLSNGETEGVNKILYFQTSDLSLFRPEHTFAG